jgi:hypothetical protein
MSGGIQQYWKDVRALEVNLPDFVWLVATAAGLPPFVTQVTKGVAAKLLHAKSHRMAADDEVEAQYTLDAATLKLAKKERMRRSGATVVVVEKAAVDQPVVEEATSEPSPRRRR